MKYHNSVWRGWTTACLLLVLLLLISQAGCSQKERHTILTFFFTGVPPLEETASVEKDNELLPIEIINPVKSESTEKTLFSHPVWLAGVCDPCHGSSGNFSFPGVREKSTSVFNTGGGMPGKLTLPKTTLCIQCHTDKTPKRALFERLWLHNTTAKGECLACHDPHQSENPKTLRQSLSLICYPCHEKGAFWQTPAHQKHEECLTCHNPHMGINRNLLKKEYKELRQPVAHINGHPIISR
ncbi:cytochrome c3 family protein [Desulfosediminicola flagellatus]|uniref:cytochrome c3 family protein n=1 Tax=Desulfosediminicola flagellatus TaxID=2569541 RepID=UPI0010ABFE13|nr:cytochrome c3 family protein [Desulfosediminicola flagellatus]